MQKMGILTKFMRKMWKEYLDNIESNDYDPVNLDAEPPKPGTEEAEGDAKYAYYDKLYISDRHVIFRYF